MNNVRMEQVRARARWRPAPIDLRRTLAFIVCAVVMFAIFFEVGHATRGTHVASSPGTFSPRELTSASVHAGIPDGLVSAAPLPAATSFRSPPPPPRHSSPAHHTAAAPVEAAPVVSAPVVSAPAATPAPAVVTPAPVQHTSAPAPSQAPSESSGGGGSFDSSE